MLRFYRKELTAATHFVEIGEVRMYVYGNKLCREGSKALDDCREGDILRYRNNDIRRVLALNRYK